MDGNGIGMQDNIRLGDNMFEDVNGDGVLDQNDYVYLGTDDPKLSYSFNVGLEWKGFDFQLFSKESVAELFIVVVKVTKLGEYL